MSSHYGAYATTIEMVERHPQLVDVMLRNKPDVAGFQLYTHRTLNGCYGNPAATGGGDSGVGGLESPVPFLMVNKAATFRSTTVVRRGWGAIGESRRGMARAYFTLDDYTLPGNDIPPDSDQAYIRVQEQASGVGWREVLGPVNTADPVLGPIYILPTPSFMNTKLPTMTFAGNAPANTGAVSLAPPPINVDGQYPNPMIIVLPRSCDELTLKNTEAAGGDSLLVSLDPGAPLIEVAAQDAFVVYDGGIKSIVVASVDNGGAGATAPAFTAVASISLGPSR